MRHHTRFRAMATLTLAMICGAWLSADTLVMRNGRRVNGRLVGVRGGQIEFEERNGWRNNVIRVDTRDVRSIEFDDNDSGGNWDNGNSGGGWGDNSGGWGDQGGQREREVMVDAREEWTDTGINVRPGQRVRFQANGKVRWGPGRTDGPQGEKDSPYNQNRPMPNRQAGALIGRVGNDSPFFIGGDSGDIRIRGGGRLYLSINDDYRQDNSGSFRVIVYY